MTNMIENDVFLTGGAEIEIHNVRGVHLDTDQWQTRLNNAGFSWVQAKYDASPNVHCEFVLPPFNLHFAGGVCACR